MTKHIYSSMSSVYRAIKRNLPNAVDVPVFREVVNGKARFAVWF